MVDKYTVLELIIACHNKGYKALRNDLIEDVKHRLNDAELALVLEMVESDVLQNLQVGK